MGELTALHTSAASLAGQGFDITAVFNAAWYNEQLRTEGSTELPPLPTFAREDGAPALLIGNSAALWPIFLKWLRAQYDPTVANPLDACAEMRSPFGGSPPGLNAGTFPHRYAAAVIGRAVQMLTMAGIKHETFWASEPAAERRVSMARAASACGLCYHDQTTELTIHPAYGAWTALRAVVVLDASAGSLGEPPPPQPCPISPEEREALGVAMRAARAMSDGAAMEAEAPHGLPPHVHGAAYAAVALPHEVALAWAAVRDAVRVGRQHRYSNEQLLYHYTQDGSILAAAARAQPAASAKLAASAAPAPAAGMAAGGGGAVGATADGPPPTELDLSGDGVSAIGDGFALPPSLLELCLMHNRISKIEKLDHLSSLTKLSLRANVVGAMEGLAGLACLEELELYENQIMEMRGLEGLGKLRVLDLSFNQIAKLAGLEHSGLVALEELYLSNNKIGAIEGLGSLPSLRLLELGSNAIRCVEGLGGVPSVQELHLGRNKIRSVSGGALHGLPALRVLGLASNRLVSLDGLQHLGPTLCELYADHNGVESMEPLSALAQLTTLDLGCNALRSMQIGGLSNLEDLWLNDNPIGEVDDLLQLADCPRLNSLRLHGSPLGRSAGYRDAVLCRAPPTLSQLDTEMLPSVMEPVD